MILNIVDVSSTSYLLTSKNWMYDHFINGFQRISDRYIVALNATAQDMETDGGWSLS